MANQDIDTGAPTREFVVVMRGPSAVIFGEGETLPFKSFPTELGPVDFTYASRWLRRSDSVIIPGHLWIEIRGHGSKLENVIPPFANAGLRGLPILALSANAAIGDPEVEVAFDNTPGIIERDYFQCYIPPESDIPYTGRLINVQATQALVEAVKIHPEADRILRATSQYRLALDSWKLGHSIETVAHLWMALEALTKAKIRAELTARGLNCEQELADSLGIDLTDLDATVRRELILRGDQECYRRAKKASDGFEHGFLGLEKVYELSQEIRLRMATLIRLAIFDLLGLNEAVKTVLVSPPYDKPMGHWCLVKYLRGKLIGEGTELARPGNAYPFVRWRPSIKRCEIGRDGKPVIEWNENLAPELAEGISFQPESYEVWQPD